jgi:hypothetical protein
LGSVTVKPGWIEDGSIPQDSKTTIAGTVITGVGDSVGEICGSVGITAYEVGVLLGINGVCVYVSLSIEDWVEEGDGVCDGRGVIDGLHV